MELWKLILITLLSAVVLGCIIGVVVGKHQLKKMSGNYRPLLNNKERIIYGACVLLGAACLAVGLFYTPPEPQMDPGAVVEGAENGMQQGEIAEGEAGAVAEEGAGTATARPRRGGSVRGAGGGTVVIMG